MKRTMIIKAQELSDEKSRFHASINSLSLGYIMADADGTIILSNDAVKNIFDTHESLKSVSDVAQYFGTPDIVHVCKECLSSKKPLNVKNIAFKNKFLKLFCAPVINNKKVIGHVLIFEDITEARILERSRDEFFATASHALRTPLTAIRGNAELLMNAYSEKIVDSEVREMISDIETASVRLIGIVNDFLEVSRLEQGKIVFEKKFFDIITSIEKIVGSMRLIIAGKDITLDFIRPQIAIPDVYADQERTEQVLFNLIGNAIKFTKKGGVNVSLEVFPHEIKVMISDHGFGIPEERQNLLFRKFQQAGEQSLVRDASQGTGLGLYIAKIITEKMGGKIGLAESKVDVGSVFFFTLPTAL